ncbi:hypothetical protein VZT92_013643 [Zoarces viviparus]|uniref:Copine-3 n=1 Tax=Zoarces viviparus TaxID=48416 RepID=A0AAW1F5N6_ZOAVI
MADCVSKVELSVSCTDLLDKDYFSKSDPLCVLLQSSGKDSWTELARTESLQDSCNVSFSQRLTVDYHFGSVQNLKLEVYDIDSESADLADHDFLGAVELTLGQIVASKTLTRPLQLKEGKPAGKGSITITAEEIKDNRAIQLEFEAKNLDKKELLSNSDPFLEFFKQGDDEKWQLVHITEVVKNNLSPSWKKFSVPLQTFCSSDLDRPLKVDCSDHNSNGTHDLIGSFTTKVSELQKAGSGSPVTFDCIHSEKQKKKKSYKNSGVVTLKGCEMLTPYSFLDYVMGGCQINFTVGIDFTGSNGDPRSPNSLHYMSPDGLNQYLSALMSVGHVVQDYDTDKLFPVYGFGAKLPPDYQATKHEFPLNPNNSYCKGIEGIIEAYTEEMPQMIFSEPRNLSPIINHISTFARQSNNASQYFVLLILTAGEITDLDQTRDAIVQASRLPLSIIIVGVGPADFKAMELLDGDDGVLKSTVGEAAARDIVQFVPYRQFKDDPQTSLAKSVLAEVPNQLVSYFKMKGLEPATAAPKS